MMTIQEVIEYLCQVYDEVETRRLTDEKSCLCIRSLFNDWPHNPNKINTEPKLDNEQRSLLANNVAEEDGLTDQERSELAMVSSLIEIAQKVRETKKKAAVVQREQVTNGQHSKPPIVQIKAHLINSRGDNKTNRVEISSKNMMSKLNKENVNTNSALKEISIPSRKDLMSKYSTRRISQSGSGRVVPVYTKAPYKTSASLHEKRALPRTTSTDSTRTRPTSASTSATRRDTSATGRDTSAKRRDTSATGRDTSATRRDISATRRDTSAKRRDTSATGRDTSATRRDTNATGRDTSATRRDISATRRDTSATRRDTSATRRDISATCRDTSATRRDTNATRKSSVVQTRHPSDENQVIPYEIQQREREADFSLVGEISKLDIVTNAAIVKSRNSTCQVDTESTPVDTEPDPAFLLEKDGSFLRMPVMWRKAYKTNRVSRRRLDTEFKTSYHRSVFVSKLREASCAEHCNTTRLLHRLNVMTREYNDLCRLLEELELYTATGTAATNYSDKLYQYKMLEHVLLRYYQNEDQYNKILLDAQMLLPRNVSDVTSGLDERNRTCVPDRQNHTSGQDELISVPDKQHKTVGLDQRLNRLTLTSPPDHLGPLVYHSKQSLLAYQARLDEAWLLRRRLDMLRELLPVLETLHSSVATSETESLSSLRRILTSFIQDDGVPTFPS